MYFTVILDYTRWARAAVGSLITFQTIYCVVTILFMYYTLPQYMCVSTQFCAVRTFTRL